VGTAGGGSFSESPVYNMRAEKIHHGGTQDTETRALSMPRTRPTRIRDLAVASFLMLLLGALADAQSEKTATDPAGQNPSVDVTSAKPAYRVAVGPAESRLVFSSDPEYTNAAKEKGIEGTVVLSATVGENGVPRDVRVVRSLDPGLDQNSIVAVQKWKFRPSLKDGKPQAVPIMIELNFKLPK
jgi:TonB family protein